MTRTDPASFEGVRLLREHTIPAMRRAIANNATQIFSPKEMRELLERLHDPDCLYVDLDHAGPHKVRPGHPKLRGPR